MAGVVVGAGSALGCAVASATTDDAGRGDGASAADTSNASESAARGGKTGPARQASRAGADTSDRAPGRAVRNTASGGVTAAERVTAPAATVNPLFPAPAPVALAAPASATTVRASSASRTASQVADPTHVLLIGVDGVNMSKVLEYAYDEPTSGFRIVMDEGVTGTTSFVGHTTLSGPSWSTILTGAWDNKTGVFNNIFEPRPYNSWPTAINLIEYNEPDVDTAVFANWQYITDIAEAGGYPADVNEFVAFDTSWEVTDDLVVDETIALIQSTLASDSAFIFSYQVAVDEAGHEAGGNSPEYRDALINTSENIARIMAAIDAWEAENPGQQWTVITTTDHGHQPQAGFGHGFQSPLETSSFVIFDLEGDDTDDGLQ
ncbi:MAG: alkaline phosphatase family protein, partial [Mycobacterium sp.]|nr:alkaline phosphatase family protein [Mycobacterium sp.]